MSFTDSVFNKTFASDPYLFLFVIFIAGSAMTTSYKVFAQKEDVKKELSSYAKSVDEKFVAIEKKMDENNFAYLGLFSRQAIMNYSSEIHTLTELDRAGKANERDRKRLRELVQHLEEEQTSMRDRRIDGGDDARAF